MKKTFFFISITYLLIYAICLNIEQHRVIDNIILIVMYIIFILVTLYDIGKNYEDLEK
jgi:hypothetical protein